MSEKDFKIKELEKQMKQMNLEITAANDQAVQR